MAARPGLEAGQLSFTLDYLGESVSSLAEAEAATANTGAMIDRIVASGIAPQHRVQADAARPRPRSRSNASPTCGQSSGGLRGTGSSSGSTWRTRRTSRRSGFSSRSGARAPQRRIVLQSALHRSEADLAGDGPRRARPARQGRVQGAGRHRVAAQKPEVDAAFLRMMRRLLEAGTFPAIATHDPAMIEATRRRRPTTGSIARAASSSRC